MERLLSSQEERIRRAEEIYARRQNLRERTRNATVNINEPKNFKLFKRLILQIIICILIYFIFYLINTTNYSFSKITLNKTNELISHDIDFKKIYNNITQTINNYIYSFEGNNVQENIIHEQENAITNENEVNEIINTIEETEETTGQTEISSVEETETDRIKNKYKFILPVNRNCVFRIWDKRSFFKYSINLP